MKGEAFGEIYSRIIEAELGVFAISHILQNASSGEEPVKIDRLNCAVGWIADRVAEQLSSVSDYAAEQERLAQRSRV